MPSTNLGFCPPALAVASQSPRMSQAELLHWCSAYQAAPPADEESEIVAQFLAAPYPYQNDDDDQDHQKQLGDDIRTGSAYWQEHVADPGAGACYWPPNADSSNRGNAGSDGGYVDDGGFYYYLGEPDVSLGINTRATLPCTSLDLNLLGDGEEERSVCAQLPVPDPNPSAADHVRVFHHDIGNDGTTVSRPKRKVPASRDEGDLRGGHRKKEKKASTSSKPAQKCFQEKAQSSSSCSGNESNCSEAQACGVNVKTRASKGSATDPQSLYARRRRERINEKLKILQKLVPNGTKVDISTMLEEAVQYVRFLQLQIKMLSSDEMWMYAPIAYNGMSLGIDLISPQ